MDYTYWSERLRENKQPPQDAEPFYLEAQGPFRLSFIIRGAACNPAEAKAQIHAIFTHYGGRIDQPVKWLFTPLGEIYISKYYTHTTEDNIMLIALSLGALDVEFGFGDVVRVLTKPERLTHLLEILETEDIEAKSSQICYRPQSLFPIDDEVQVKTIIALMNDLAACAAVLDISADFQLNDLVCKRAGYEE